MEKRIKILIIMSTITVIFIGTVYANTITTEKFYSSGTYYLATLYKAEPGKWYYPEELGIIHITERNETHLSVSIPDELDSGDLDVRKPIFKYKDRFYQIQYATLRWDALQVPTEFPLKAILLLLGGRLKLTIKQEVMLTELERL